MTQNDTKKLRCDDSQLAMLLRCSEKEDVTEWNDWRRKNLKVEIWLEGALLSGAYLAEVDLSLAHLKKADLSDSFLERANLSKACLHEAQLAKANLTEARLFNVQLQRAQMYETCLRRADLSEAHLEEASLEFALLENANLWYAYLQRANLGASHLEETCLEGAHLEGVYLDESYLEGAKLSGANLEGANLKYTNLQGAKFKFAVVDSKTIISECSVDRETDFRGVGLDSIRITPGIKELLKYNVRRMNWQDWYKKHRLWKWPMRAFWSASDYGGSTGRILLTFFGFAFMFAVIFYWNPSFLSNGCCPLESISPMQSIYFSVVTMTTLGFGDLHAAESSSWGQFALMVEVLLGYTLLGALITRFAVLFNAEGPSGNFAKKKPKNKWRCL